MAENTKTFTKGTLIFPEGAWEMWMYRVISGKVAIYAAYGTENEKLLTEVEPGKFFGEMGLIEARFRSAAAVATEDTVCELINGKDLGKVLQNDPEQAFAILTNISKRIRELSAEYTDTCALISEYVGANEPQKKSLWSKVQKLMDFADKYSEAYNEIARTDPTFASNFQFWY